MQTYDEAIDAYIQGFEPEKQVMMDQLRSLIHALVPGVVESIKWRMPTFSLPDKGDVIHFAAFKGHIGLYPLPEAIDAFEAELEQYHTSKGAIQFPVGQPLPMPLIEEIIRFRCSLVEAKKPKKRT
ncbi:MAG: iron chaperone [Sphaerochaeta sp.]|uniref:iron chaperone n=1 Tax=Sphaerochaeta sp. TaxID=1972642 RepID=UPI003D146A4B